MLLKDRIALQPLRVGAIAALCVLLAIALYSVFAPHAAHRNQAWYGDEFTLRGSEKHTLGRAIILPTREVGDQQAPSIAIVEGLKIPAAQFPLLSVNFFDRDSAHRIALIWRNSIEPNLTQRFELESSADGLERVAISSHKGWQGTISGIGIIGIHPNNRALTVMRVGLETDSVESRWKNLTGPLQMALSRPRPGQDNVGAGRQIKLLPWAVSVVLLCFVGFAWISARWIAGKALLAALLSCAATFVAGVEILRLSNLETHTRLPNQVHIETVLSLRAALAQAKPEHRLVVMSGDASGHALALAVAPRHSVVYLGEQALPDGTHFLHGDIVAVLARRGVKFSPRSNTLEWLLNSASDAHSSMPVILMSAGRGDAIFRVNRK